MSGVFSVLASLIGSGFISPIDNRVAKGKLCSELFVHLYLNFDFNSYNNHISFENGMKYEIPHGD